MTYPNWFEPYARKLFERHLLPLAGKPGLRFLQIGAFTGDASVWLLENVLTGNESCLIDVDTWEGSDEPEHKGFDWADVERTYHKQVSEFSAHRVTYRTTSSDYFERFRAPAFDFIYVDGDHTPYGVLNDAVDAFRVLKLGGLLAFDDYQWVDSRTGIGPGPIIDAFAWAYRDRLELVQSGPQAWFRRIA